MSEKSRPGPGAEFLDDFYAECDEQLTAIREALVTLEASINDPQPNATAVEKLFRNFHSFKGNCAMVGLRQGENLAHAAEDLLRGVTRNRLKLTAEGLDLLMTAAQRLEQMAAGHREHKPLPEVESLVARFGELCGTAQPAHVPREESASVSSTHQSPPPAEAEGAEHVRSKGLGLWRFRFRPNRELDAHGINVKAVRERLLTFGEILRATPHVKGDSVEFEFLVALKEAPDVVAWESDGITSEMVEAEAAQMNVASLGDVSPAVETAAGPFVAPSHVVRVDLGRLDELMRITGEMVIHRARMEDLITKISARNTGIDARSLQEVNLGLGRSLRELREGIMRVRLVPVAEIFSRLPFVVRDLARETGRKVQLTFSGQETEIDKFIVERLKDPLLHLVRNAISHGIELPRDRVNAGKPETATLSFRASTVGDSVLIEVGDDGRGVNRDAVREKALENGLPVPPVLSDTALLDLICAPGFSTRGEADRAAGRGVGMSAVQSTVRELGGTLSLETDERGTRFLMRLPLTLAIADVFIVCVDQQICAVPQTFVQEIVQVNRGQIRQVGSAEIVPYRDGVLPLARLRSLFRMELSAKADLPVLVLISERGMIGLVVDRVIGQREVVVQALRDPLVQVPGVTGATELGDGKPVLILDGASLTSGASRPMLDADRVGARFSSIAITD